MPISLGIRLVILLPTFLFIVGFFFRGIIEKNELNKLKGIVHSIDDMRLCDVVFDRLEKFYFLIALDSMFIFMANGLIIIFEMSNSELGILVLIAGILSSTYLLISYAAAGGHAVNAVNIIFGIVGGEFSYFLFYDVNIVTEGGILQILLMFFGAFVAMFLCNSVILSAHEDMVVSMRSFIDEKRKNCEQCKK